jgi:hypothetical protein
VETATAAPPPGRDAPALAPRAGAALAAGATLLLTAACDPGRPAAPAARPSPSPAYSSAGGPVVLQRVAVGQYRADFHKLGRTPDAAGTGAHGTEVALATSAVAGVACNAALWSSAPADTTLQVHVSCADVATGAYRDARFNVLVVGDASLPARSAFALAEQPTATLYAPDAAYRYTSGPGALGVSRRGVGDWELRLGTGAPQGAIQLVNTFSGRRVCKIAEYKSLGPRVRCYGTDGQHEPQDVQFQVLQAEHGRPGRRFGLAWADQPTRATPYAPHAAYVRNSSGGAVRVARAGVGAYAVRFEGLQRPGPLRREHVQLTAFGPGFSSCTLGGVRDDPPSSTPAALVVDVRCTDQHGQLADSRFNVMVIE